MYTSDLVRRESKRTTKGKGLGATGLAVERQSRSPEGWKVTVYAQNHTSNWKRQIWRDHRADVEDWKQELLCKDKVMELKARRETHSAKDTIGKGGDVLMENYVRQKRLNQANITSSGRQGSQNA